MKNSYILYLKDDKVLHNRSIIDAGSEEEARRKFATMWGFLDHEDYDGTHFQDMPILCEEYIINGVKVSG